eukprot:1138897-Pelagomonas_calceolata.AAC.1
MDVSLFWKELDRVTDLRAVEVAVAGAECFLFPPHPPLLLNGYRELVLGTKENKTKVYASQAQMHALREGSLACKLARASPRRLTGQA